MVHLFLTVRPAFGAGFLNLISFTNLMSCRYIQMQVPACRLDSQETHDSLGIYVLTRIRMNKAAFLDDQEAIRDLEREGEDLLRHDQCEITLLLQLVQRPRNVLDDRRLYPFCRFIEDQYLWVGNQCTCYRKLLLLAA